MIIVSFHFQLNLASSHKMILFFLCPTNLSLVKLSKAFCSSLPPVHLSYLPPAVELKQNWSTEPDTFIKRTSSQSSEKKLRTLSHTFKQSKYRLKIFTLLLELFLESRPGIFDTAQPAIMQSSQSSTFIGWPLLHVAR